MIYLGILNIANIDPEIAYVSAHKLGDAVKNRIDETKDPEMRLSRLGVYSLLYKMYEELKKTCGFPSDIPQIFYTGEGKPCFYVNESLQNVPKFNISHDGGVAVCAISTSADVGVDVQSMAKRKFDISKIFERFFAPMRNLDHALDSHSGAKPEYKVRLYKISDGKIVSFDADATDVPKISNADLSSDLLAKWTLIEAVVKMSGGGFFEKEKVADLIQGSKSATISFYQYEKEYYVTIAENN